MPSNGLCIGGRVVAIASSSSSSSISLSSSSTSTFDPALRVPPAGDVVSAGVRAAERRKGLGDGRRFEGAGLSIERKGESDPGGVTITSDEVSELAPALSVSGDLCD